MMQFNRGASLDEAALMSAMITRINTRENFSLPYTKEQTKLLLTAAIKTQIGLRGRVYNSNEKLEAIIDKVASWLIKDDKADTVGLLLCGGLGNGKTTIALAIASLVRFIEYEVVHNGRHNSQQFKLVDARTLVQISRHDRDNFLSVQSTPLLIIDDLGCEPVESNDYGNVTNPVVEVLSHRYQFQLSTIITTNLGVKDIRTKYGDRIADRFNEMMTKVVFTFGSFR